MRYSFSSQDDKRRQPSTTGAYSYR